MQAGGSADSSERCLDRSDSQAVGPGARYCQLPGLCWRLGPQVDTDRIGGTGLPQDQGETVMKHWSIALFMCAVAAVAQSVPEIPYDSVPNFFKPAADLHFGEVAGVAVNSKGHVFVFSRGNTTGPA